MNRSLWACTLLFDEIRREKIFQHNDDGGGGKAKQAKKGTRRKGLVRHNEEKRRKQKANHQWGRVAGGWKHQSEIVIAVVDDEKEWYLLDRTSYLSLNYAHNSAQDISIQMPDNSSKTDPCHSYPFEHTDTHAYAFAFNRLPYCTVDARVRVHVFCWR